MLILAPTNSKRSSVGPHFFVLFWLLYISIRMQETTDRAMWRSSEMLPSAAIMVFYVSVRLYYRYRPWVVLEQEDQSRMTPLTQII
jgi:hypothetical protein